MPPSVSDSTEPARFTVIAPAKINLALSVGPLRPDGFHELRTVFQAVDLYDTVTVQAAAELELAMSGTEAAGLPTDPGNLAWRAAALLAERAGRAPCVRIELVKRIPVAAGLAGGSADAAATLVACNRLWRLGLTDTELTGLAAELGSDVAFALHGGTALGAGRGETLTELPAGQLHWVLAAAAGSLSTPAVYAELDRQRTGQPTAEPAALDALVGALRTGVPIELAPLLANDLQPAALALAPYLRDTLAAGARLGALAGLVSGSGPTCAFLAADAGQARSLATALDADPSCRFARTVVGGVPGATVLKPTAAAG
ncbi:MAG TPA: 4-(cytidine 5'-diphospho)-2-C-methyl-D-erythritol kinase [Jatrophihabitans sp.]|nr:4-(cytidine 5'-diphospho)-2-C-methyl-D-erythritol kinase [Jatrophihabitans sp.]